MHSGSNGKRTGRSEREASRDPCMWTVDSGDEGGSAPGLVMGGGGTLSPAQATEAGRDSLELVVHHLHLLLGSQGLQVIEAGRRGLTKGCPRDEKPGSSMDPSAQGPVGSEVSPVGAGCQL